MKSFIYLGGITFSETVQLLTWGQQTTETKKNNKIRKKRIRNPKGVKIYKIHWVDSKFERHNEMDTEYNEMRIK